MSDDTNKATSTDDVWTIKVAVASSLPEATSLWTLIRRLMEVYAPHDRWAVMLPSRKDTTNE